MTPEAARQVLAEAARRAETKFPRYIRECHERQLAFFKQPGRFKAILAGRRGGKTEIDVRGLCQAAGRKPYSIAAYMGVTQRHARRLAWPKLVRLVRRYGLPIRFNKNEMVAYHQNGAEIWILGADKEDDRMKALGAAYSRFIIDEAASHRGFIEDMVTEDIEPALGDYDGDIWITGSPGRAPVGYFHRITTGQKGYEKWRTHRWTVRENPFFRNGEAEQYLAERLAENGWTVDNPTFRRQYLGEWVRDDDALVYKFDRDVNGADRVPWPLREATLILAIDFGVVDPCAFVVLAFHPHDATVYVLEATAEVRLSPSECGLRVRALQERWGEVVGRSPELTFEAIVGDSPGVGKPFCEEMAKRYSIFVEPAKKTEKVETIALMNGEWKAGRIKVVLEHAAALANEYETLVWKEKESRLLPVYDEAMHDDHCADATLYGWRKARGWAWERRSPRPDRGSPEETKELARQIEEEEARRARRRRLRDEGEDGYNSEEGDELEADLWPEDPDGRDDDLDEAGEGLDDDLYLL